MTGPNPQEVKESDAARLTTWLMALVHNRQYGDLAQLRRATAGSSTKYRAGWFATDQAERDVFEQVAFLFAVYHRGVQKPTPGYDSFGAAARRIGRPGARGPADPGASRLLDRIVSDRRISWRHLQHGIARLRACEQQPPSWAGLVTDLGRWNDRKARVADRWAVDFHEPQDLRRTVRQKGGSK
ncbi:type I-E CRISPR-associated protein Cse2/CasB [Kitasatospora purpeofusca]|uniref:type I-E CRISPR-associated protein Cse2/CasB n=1 Tax=Kitasatospora purpeofusca TaxID=67352 RepID=UPI00225514F9|nr:type I-E CRISPR-associated protein Cse2/CasB [Kitasatospora purpeofusca]MCX4685204.1 type I-E CRISPR-associated protein Cse2/CasB [Kitasatospora purpeofusca]